MQLAPGTRVGSFTILAPIGSGGMGALYRARDEKLRREVAIKILQEKLAGSEENLRRFQREARSASALNHPNIVTIFAVDEFDGSPFIAMELIDGESLRDMLKQGPLPVRKLVSIASQIAEGLAAAHERGIVHRDLKPDNVMITSGGLAKILDFGVARFVQPALSDESTAELTIDTPAGQVVGTAAYMSPEQASGRPVDFRSDQFSLGSTLYELATGRRAFRRDSMADTLAAIINDEPEPVQRLNPKLPPALCSVINRCLAKDPNDRYASTRDLARELQALRDSASATVPAKATNSRGAAAAAIAAVTVLIAVGIIFNRSRASRLNAQSLPAQKFIAVLPFKDLSGRPDGQLFSQGFAESVSARLAKYSGIQVIPPPSAAPLISKGADFRRIAQELGATLLLSASVQRAGDELRVSYTLVEPQRGNEVAGDTVNGSVRSLWDVQDEVANDVARDLGIVEKGLVTSHVGLDTAEEQDEYVRALGALERPDDAKSIEKSISLLHDLLETASESALVYSALGRAYLAAYAESRDPQTAEKAIKACNRARVLDPTSPDVLLTLAAVKAKTGNYDQAIAIYQRALSLQPDSPPLAIGLADAYRLKGNTADAERFYKRGIALRPTWWSSYNSLGILYLGMRRYADAGQQFRRAIELNPESPWGYTNLGNVFASQGDLVNASKLYKESLGKMPNGDAYANLGYCLYFLGEFDESAASYRKAIALRPHVSTYWASLADACAWSATCRADAAKLYREASGLLVQDLQLNPNNARLQAILAICLAKDGARANAKQHLDRALRLNGSDPSIMYKAARVSVASGDEKAAIDWLRRALAAGYERFEIDRDPDFNHIRRTDYFQTVFSPAGPTQSTQRRRSI